MIDNGDEKENDQQHIEYAWGFLSPDDKRCYLILARLLVMSRNRLILALTSLAVVMMLFAAFYFPGPAGVIFGIGAGIVVGALIILYLF